MNLILEHNEKNYGANVVKVRYFRIIILIPFDNSDAVRTQVVATSAIRGSHYYCEPLFIAIKERINNN